jgi:lipopolysaccharide export system permease protein
LLESLEEIVYGRLRTTRSYSNNKLKVSVRRVEGRQLIQPMLLYYGAGKEQPTTIVADLAEIRHDSSQEKIVLVFTNADIDLHGTGTIYHPGELEYPISLADFAGRKARRRSPSQYSFRELSPSRTEQIALIQQLEQEAAAEASHALMTGRIFELSEENWRQKKRALANAAGKLHRLNTEPYRRWANGFSCLCFMMIGAPMAIRLRHGEIWGSFFACFLPILLVYYPMLAGCLDFAKDGVLPPQTVWLGNIVLALWGLWLVRRVIRF